MSDVNEIINLLSAKEQTEFVQYLKDRNKRKNIDNTALFKAFVGGKEKQLKINLGSNAFNVAKKRLTDRLLDYLATLTIESAASTEVSIIRRLVLSRNLFAHEKWKLAFKMMEQLEKEAIAINHYSLLNEIYHTYTEYSYHSDSPDQELIYKRFETNQANFITQERLNMVYAVIKKAFNASEHGGEEIDLEALLRHNFEKFNISEKHAYNFQTLHQLAIIADLSGAHSRRYDKVDVFFEGKIHELQGGPLDTEKFIVYHIDVLYLLANIYFRKKDFKKSMYYLEIMKENTLRFDGKFERSRIVKYSVLKALNLNFTGQHAVAADLLDKLIADSQYALNELLNVYLTRVMIAFQQNELQLASKHLARLHHSDAYYDKLIGQEWTLNKRYIEILLHIELGNYDFVDSRINSLVRKYSNQPKSSKQEAVIPFLKLVKKYYHHPELVTSEEFKTNVEHGIDWKPREQEDIFLMCFYAWLKSKMINKPIYETTLELVTSTLEEVPDKE